MATNITAKQEAPAAGRDALVPVKGGGWLGGFGNMLSKELGEWFGTRRWLVQSLLWLSMINGFIAFVIFFVPLIAANIPLEPGEAPPPPVDVVQTGLALLFSFAAMGGAIGAIIIAQDEIVGEKQSG